METISDENLVKVEIKSAYYSSECVWAVIAMTAFLVLACKFIFIFEYGRMLATLWRWQLRCWMTVILIRHQHWCSLWIFFSHWVHDILAYKKIRSAGWQTRRTWKDSERWNQAGFQIDVSGSNLGCCNSQSQNESK